VDREIVGGKLGLSCDRQLLLSSGKPCDNQPSLSMMIQSIEEGVKGLLKVELNPSRKSMPHCVQCRDFQVDLCLSDCNRNSSVSVMY
jgi:hypothetical protein